jgi:small subunit ribosomal protein S5e
MMHGRNNGKKLKAVKIIRHAMEIIHLLTDQNPVQVIVDAVVNRYNYCPAFCYFLPCLLFLY